MKTFTFGSAAQQSKQPAPNFNFGDLQNQNKSSSSQMTPAHTGVVFATSSTATTTSSVFSFACANPIQESAPNKGFFNEALPDSRFSSFTANTSTHLASSSSKTLCATTGFCVPSLIKSSESVPTMAVAGFGNTTATAKPLQSSFRNETDANKSLRFGFGSSHKKNPFILIQNASNVNLSNNYTFFTSPNIAPSMSSTAPGFVFKNTLGSNTGFNAAQINDSNAFPLLKIQPQQPSKFQFNIPASHTATNSSSCPVKSSCSQTHGDALSSSQFLSSKQPGNGGGFNVPNRTVLKKAAVIENQCNFCMRDCENKSFEEKRLEFYHSTGKGVPIDPGLRIKTGACNFSFLNATQSSQDSALIKNGDVLNQIQNNQNSAVFATPSSFTTEPFRDGRTFNVPLFEQNKEHKDDGGSVDQAKLSHNLLKPIFDDPKCKSIGDCEGSGCLNPNMSQHINRPPTNNDVKRLAFDSLVALMVISKTKSVQDILNMIPGNVGLDEFKAHLISVTEEFSNELLTKKVDELVKQLAKISSKVIYIKLPSGEILIRSFMARTPLSLLLEYVASQGYPNVEYKVMTMWSRQDLTLLNQNQTLEDLKLYPKDYLTVEKRCSALFNVEV